MEFDNEGFFDKFQEDVENVKRSLELDIKIKNRERREKIAIAAMEGILSGSSVWPDMTDREHIAIRSVCMADALIKELDK